MALSKKSRKRRLQQRRKRRSKTRKMKGGGFFDSKKQSIEDIHYENRIPIYLPNLAKGHESFPILQSIITKHSITNLCEKKSLFKNYKFKDILPNRYLKYSHDSSPVNTKISHWSYGGGDSWETIYNVFMPLPQLVMLGKESKPNYKDRYATLPEMWIYGDFKFFSRNDIYINKPLNFSDLREEFAWCKSEFPAGWTCTSTAITQIQTKIKNHNGTFDNTFELEKHKKIDPHYFSLKLQPYDSNKITYYFNQKEQFEVNCFRYAPGYIDIEVVDNTSPPTLETPSPPEN